MSIDTPRPKRRLTIGDPLTMPERMSTPPPPDRRARLLIAVAGLAITLILGSFVWTFGPTVEKRLSQLSHNTELSQRKALLLRQLKELVDAEEEANLMALARAKTELFKTFDTYASHAPQFAKEIAGFRNRLSIATKSASDSVNKTNETGKFIGEIFGQQVVQPQQMNKDIQKIITRFHRDLETNRGILIIAATRRIHEADLPDSQYELSENTLRDKLLQQIAQEKSRVSRAKASINGTEYNDLSIAEESTQTLNAQIARVGASNIVLEVILKAGTAVGLVIGLGIGYIADEWLSTRLQKKIIKNTQKALAKIRDDIWGNRKTGLKAHMEQAIQQNKQISVRALDKVVMSEI